MPRTIIRNEREHDRSFSLGRLALAWVEHLTVYGPGAVQGELVTHGDEYAGFYLDTYALRKADGRLLYDEAFISRPKGCDKSGLAARFVLFEGLGPCRYAGVARGGEVYQDPWGLGFKYRYTRGEPMGMHVKRPFIRILATEEGQTLNTYNNIWFNLQEEGPLKRLQNMGVVNCGVAKTVLPGQGIIFPSTASAASKDGGQETFVVADESHLYCTPDLRRMYATVSRNLTKQKRSAGSWMLNTSTMFSPGQESVAETLYTVAQDILEGRVKRAKLLFDHRWGDIDNRDLKNEELLSAAIIEAYGDAIAWNDVEGIIDQIFNPLSDIVDSRRYFLNAETSGKNAWLDNSEYDACAKPDMDLNKGDVITLGFDGAKREDSTALVACRVRDGFLTFIDMGDGTPSIWEKPKTQGKHDDPDDDDWEVPGGEVDAAVAIAFREYKVVGFFADTPYWSDYIDAWTAKYASKLKVKSTLLHPIRWLTSRPKPMVDALARFKEAIKSRHVIHQGRDHPFGRILRRHSLNAQRRQGRMGIIIAKEYPKSPRKIDALMAAVLAYEARQEAISLGLNKVNSASVPVRVR